MIAISSISPVSACRLVLSHLGYSNHAEALAEPVFPECETTLREILETAIKNSGPSRRVCAACGHQIKKGHKWQFNHEMKCQHRNCNNPDSYKS